MTKDNRIGRVQILQGNISREQLGNAGGVNGKIRRLILEQIAFLGAIINKGAVGGKRRRLRGGEKIASGIALVIFVIINMRTDIALFTAGANIPVAFFVVFPYIAKAVLVGWRSNVGTADITFTVCIRIGVIGQIGYLSAIADVPMMVIIKEPLGTENMHMGQSSVANVAGIVSICVDVGLHIGSLTAAAAVPMLVFVGFPSFAKAMLVGWHRKIALANIALVV